MRGSFTRPVGALLESDSTTLAACMTPSVVADLWAVARIVSQSTLQCKLIGDRCVYCGGAYKVVYKL